jgi:ferredoxin
MSVKFFKDHALVDSETCLSGLNLLAHAQMLELDVGSQCGGHGRCGADRVQLDLKDSQKVNPATSIERAHLSQHEIDRGIRLACQCFPNQDQDEIIVKVMA